MLGIKYVTKNLANLSRPFIILALSMSLAVSPLAPSGFIVNDSGDAGDLVIDGNCATAQGKCTLRAAIDEANASGGGLTLITIPALVITLQSMLTVTKAVNIQGVGATSTLIDGGSPNLNIKSVRGFYFTPYSGSHTLAGLSIRNMGVTSATDPVQEDLRTGNGGAILNEATLALTNVTIDSNQADQGGGIYNMIDFIGGANNSIVPSLTLNDVKIINNRTTSSTPNRHGGGLSNGGAMDATNVTISGNSAYQGAGWYNNNPHFRGISYTVTMRNFMIDHNTAYSGAGIDNDLSATITLANGAIVSNTATGGTAVGGAAIYNNFDDRASPLFVLMSLTDVTLSGNRVTGSGGLGGAIINIEAMTLDRVTISGNSANYGAGIHNGTPNGAVPNSLTVSNSSISGNSGLSLSQSRGGGIFNTYNGVVRVSNSTVTQNSAVGSGGLDNYVNLLAGNFVMLSNSILAGNSGSPGFGPECEGRIQSGGYNVVGNTTKCTFLASTGDNTNVSNPGLGPLRNNGGPTLTHALLSYSPALDAVGSGCPPPTVDQRGVSRPQRSHCDAGAFESRANGQDSGNPIYLPIVVRP